MIPSWLSPYVLIENDLLMKVEVSAADGFGMNLDALYEIKTDVQPDVKMIKPVEMTSADHHGSDSQSCVDRQNDTSGDYDGSTDCEGGRQEEVTCRTVKPMTILCRYCGSPYAKVYYY